MAVTHADLEMDSNMRGLGKKKGIVVMSICTVLGLVAFSLCLIAESTKSQVIWVYKQGKRVSTNFELGKVGCIYSNSPKTPLLCTAGALLAVFVAVTLNQTNTGHILYRLLTNNEISLVSISRSSHCTSTLFIRLQALSCFVMVWLCFVAATILLFIGVAIEADHFGEHGKLHLRCLVVKQGIFAAAGVLALASTNSGVACYIVATFIESETEP
ncbi:hypothetical protein O6H91_06G009300 [Diphasiastrum complanatum]|uniref:Uncharacterized protein n=2 Tax=Diphasiastrum complanatum TaxID=34168 RepID=A0ACC2DB01_DIPCM|nr:hypothetical protein O6H91_06G007700 [Diphasiastrum complanatum]KAJ7551303.1 hypothetical protein O6H91_06G009300 [Diphasiastrum complanatum]